MNKFFLIAAVSVASFAFAGGKQVQVPVDSLKWEEPFGPGSIKTATISGDPKKGPYSLLMKLPPGFDSSWHTHDSDYTAVVLAGTIENVEQGGEADAKPLAAGSSWTQSAKKNHFTKCVSADECTFYIANKGGFSFHPMTPEGKPAPVLKKEPSAAAGAADKKPAAPAK